MHKLCLAASLVLFSALSLDASLIPVSSCADNSYGNITTPLAGFSCFLYPSTSAGDWSPVVTVQLPADTLGPTANGYTSVSSGFIVLEDPLQQGNSNIQNVTQCFNPTTCAADVSQNGGGGVGYNIYGTQDSNTANWTQVVEWVASPETNTTATGYPAIDIMLYTVGCGIDLANISCFPATSLLLEQAYFQTYNGPDQFLYAPDATSGQLLQHDYLVTFVPAPEPSTYMFAIGGLALLVGMKKKASQSR